MSKDYSFNLDWSDLPEDLTNEKIDEYIAYLFDSGDFDGEDRSLAECQEDPDQRKSADRIIASHFPVYF